MTATLSSSPQPRQQRRTQKQRRTETRQTILNAALAKFNQNGYHATSMADIARQAGVSKGLLHYHFDTKERLAAAVEERMVELLFKRIMATASPLKPSVKQAIWALDEVWNEIQDAENLVPISLDLASRATSDNEQRQRMQAMIAGITELLRQGSHNVLGPIADQTKVNENELADLLLVMFAGMALGNSLLDDSTRLQILFSNFKRMLLSYVLPTEFQEELHDSTA